MYRFYIILQCTHFVLSSYMLFCIIVQCNIPVLSFHISVLHFPAIYCFRIVTQSIVSVLFFCLPFLYYHPMFPFCIILPCAASVLCSHLPFPYYPPMYPLSCTNLLCISAVYYFPTYCVHFPTHACGSSYGKAAEHVADLLFHLGPRLRMCGTMLPLLRMPSWPARRQVYCFALPSHLPHVLPIAASLI